MISLKQILTPREFEIAGWVSKGKEYKEIAKILNLSYHTIKRMVQNTFERLGIENRVGLAVRYALEEERGLYK